MIRRLTLKNWRNYRDASIPFEAGTTFVVASNGVGKTSLVEAARWALFGTIKSGDTAIRAGADSALATLELQLPDMRILSIERVLSSRQRGSGPLPVVRIDGRLVPHEELQQHLISAYGTDPRFLAGLTMPAIDRDHDKPSALDLEGHLGRYYGIDGLRKAVDQLKARRKANESLIKRIKDVNATSSQRLVQLLSERKKAARRVNVASKAHVAAQARLDRARERERLDAAVDEWQKGHSAWAEAVDRLAVQVSADLDRPITADTIERVLTGSLADLDQQVEAVRAKVAVNDAKEAVLTANDQRLGAAHDDCPVCRRPLDDATVALAHEANSREISVIRASLLKLRTAETELVARRERIKEALSEWRRIPLPVPRPQVPAADEAELVSTAQLVVTVDAALDALVDARAAHAQATREVDGAQAANEAMRELETLFAQQARLRVAIEATESTLTELLDDTIRPLAAEVDQRWGALFPGRGDVNTHADGDITRIVDGHQLPFDSFSTAESMGATIILRLLVAEMATNANFCWFDEPLEHLDPDVRRKVANLLSQVTSGEGPLMQVVVTTYEEPLARQLWTRDRQRVRLLDVREAS